MLSEKFLRKCICQALILLVLSRTSSLLVKGLCLFQLLGEILLYFHKEHPVRRTRVSTVTHTHRRAIRHSRPAQTLLVGTSAGGDGHCSSGGSSNPPVNTTTRNEKLVPPALAKTGNTKSNCRPRLKRLRRHMSKLFLGCCRGGTEKL